MTRPDLSVTYREYRPQQLAQLTPPKFYTKHLAVGILGEALIHKMGYVGTLSITTFLNEAGRKLRGFQLIRGADAKKPERSANTHKPPQDIRVAEKGAGSTTEGGKVPTEGGEVPTEGAGSTTEGGEVPTEGSEVPTEGAGSTTEGSEVPTEGAGSTTEGSEVPTKANPQETAGTTSKVWCDSAPSQLQGVCESTGTLTGRVSNYFTENADWLLLTGGVALTSAAINHFAAKRIKNAYFRNTVSVLGGAAVVWGVAFGLSYLGYSNPVEFSKTVDIGARLLGYHAMLKMATPFTQGSMFFVSKAINPLRTPFAFEPPKQKRS